LSPLSCSFIMSLFILFPLSCLFIMSPLSCLFILFPLSCSLYHVSLACSLYLVPFIMFPLSCFLYHVPFIMAVLWHIDATSAGTSTDTPYSGTGFSPGTLAVPCQYHTTNAHYSLILLPPTLHNLRN
jgi:hypothetical protein